MRALLAPGGSKYPAHGGYDCAGRIDQIVCVEDKDGLVAGLAYSNEYQTSPTGFCRGAQSPQPSDVVTTLTLAPTESIVSVTACRGTKYGYSSVFFALDSGRNMTCGHAAPDALPEGYSSSYARDYTAGKYLPGYKPRGGRGLLEEGATPDAKSYKKAGWGWSR